jgi:RND superfamily putative drug exporter
MAKSDGGFENSFLYRMGKWSAHRKWLVISTWLVILAGVYIVGSALNGTFNAQLSLPNTPTQIGANLISSHTNQPSSNSNNHTGSVVFHVSEHYSRPFNNWSNH